MPGKVPDLARPRHIVEGNIQLQRGVAFISDAFPGNTGIHRFFYGSIALQDKARHSGDLYLGAPFGFVPYPGGQDIFPLPEVRLEVHRLKIPVVQVAPGRAKRDHLPVHKKLVAVIG